MIPTDRQIRLMSHKDRASLGLMTHAEGCAKLDAKREKVIQQEIHSYLNLRGFVVIRQRTDKRSNTTPGLPDILFSVKMSPTWAIPIALEVKTATGKVTPEQAVMHAKMRENGWQVHVVRGVEDVKRLLDGSVNHKLDHD